jgi:hypothetical protein
VSSILLANFFDTFFNNDRDFFFRDAWWCFPFEAMEALSCHLMWVAAATYCALLAPKNLLATLIGVLGMAHFSLGRGRWD